MKLNVFNRGKRLLHFIVDYTSLSDVRVQTVFSLG